MLRLGKWEGGPESGGLGGQKKKTKQFQVSSEKCRREGGVVEVVRKTVRELVYKPAAAAAALLFSMYSLK